MADYTEVTFIKSLVNQIADPRQRPDIVNAMINLDWHPEQKQPKLSFDDIEDIGEEVPEDQITEKDIYDLSTNSGADVLDGKTQLKKFDLITASLTELATEADESTDPAIAPTEEGKGSWLGDKYRDVLAQIKISTFKPDEPATTAPETTEDFS